MSLTLMYITNDPEIARTARKYGVDRIWVDLETRGKSARQPGGNTVLSRHSIEDISKIASTVGTSDLLVRINPLYYGSKKEIDAVVDAGADMIMLPMWSSPDEISTFVDLVDRRAKTVLLLETAQAVECLDTVLEAGGFDEIHIGLNDLHLSCGLSFMFELLSNGTVERLCQKISAHGIPYGFGGIAAIGEGLIPAEKIILEHYRLGSTRTILSRSFCNAESVNDLDEIDRIFQQNMKKLRDFLSFAENADEKVLEENKESLKLGIERVVQRLKKEATV